MNFKGRVSVAGVYKEHAYTKRGKWPNGRRGRRRNNLKRSVERKLRSEETIVKRTLGSLLKFNSIQKRVVPQ
jgi:hypothetical protein